ncbi:MAG: hypothetical protein VX265_17245 [Myxococcota bacterium]|nr:hypothetical protein [Myxococcota bacterium]
MLGLLAVGSTAAALSAAPPIHPTAAVLTGGSDPGVWDTGLAAGFPWHRVRAQRGLRNGWTPFVETSAALLTRWRPAVGVSLPWINRVWRLSGEATLGWLEQGGTLSERGPSASLAMTMGRTRGVVLPYLHAGSEHTLHIDRVIIDTAAGDVIEDAPRHGWTLTGALGLGIALGGRWGLDVGLDLPWVNVPKVSLPGVHLGLQFGGAR